MAFIHNHANISKTYNFGNGNSFKDLEFILVQGIRDESTTTLYGVKFQFWMDERYMHMQWFFIFFNATHMSNFTSPLVVENVVYYMELRNNIMHYLGHTLGTNFTNTTLKFSVHICPMRVGYQMKLQIVVINPKHHILHV